MIHAIAYSAKAHDREFLLGASRSAEIKWSFESERLSEATAPLAEGNRAVCIFVNDRATREVLKTLSQAGIGLLALRCAGYDQIDLEAASEFGIAVVRVPAYSPYAVAEHTVGLLLSLVRRIPQAFRRVKELNFTHAGLVGFDLHGKTAGIVGTGKIGRITAQILLGLGMRVLATDPFPSQEWAIQQGVEYTDFNTLLSSSKVVSLHLPLNSGTRNILNRESFSRMQSDSVLLNTGRGGLVDTRELIEALKSGQLAGAALDVYAGESEIFFEDRSGNPLQDDILSVLLNLPNLLLTPHQAFLTSDALQEIARVTTENLLQFEAAAPFLPSTEIVAAHSS
jgi:D-lactate dehydrogenase